MDALNIHRLYTHQIEAIRHIRAGKNVLVATETASGKTLVYTLSVLEKILENPDTKALFLFPLKALEHDQLKNLSKWLDQIESLAIGAAIYDGDTTPHQRKKIRQTRPTSFSPTPTCFTGAY
jgi:DEAD/DEAH box helicase domain-containing protein